MNYKQRILISIIRNKGKTIIMFLLVFLLSNFIAGSYAITESTNTVKNRIKEELTGILSIHEKVNSTEYLEINDLLRLITTDQSVIKETIDIITE